MKTIEDIRDLMVGKSVITNLADLLRANDEEFAESEKKYLAAVETLRSELPTEFVPTLDAYLDACEAQLWAQPHHGTLAGNFFLRHRHCFAVHEPGNRALAYMLKAYGMIHDPVEDILDCYFRACSILVNCQDLANIGFVFANHGLDPRKGIQFFPPEYARYVNATLATCGMYDGSGEFALNVGFPAKSGVGGGIMGVIPKKKGIAVFSPALDKRGNSIAGVQVLARLSNKLDLSIF